MKQLDTAEKCLDMLEDIQDRLSQVPQGNSQFQTEKFIIASSITPERAYRNILVNMRGDLEVVYSNLEELKKLEKKFEEESVVAEEKIKNSKDDQEISEIKRYMRRDRLEIEKVKCTIRDAIHNINVMDEHLQKMPRYNREQFEYGEGRYYLEHLKRQAMGLDGAKSSLLAMFDDMKALENFEEKYKALPKDQQHLLQKITEESLTNLSDNPVLSRSHSNSLEDK